jgi:ubiquitin C-terminal hydrolase
VRIIITALVCLITICADCKVSHYYAQRSHLFFIDPQKQDEEDGVIGDEGYRWKNHLNFNIDGKPIKNWHFFPIVDEDKKDGAKSADDVHKHLEGICNKVSLVDHIDDKYYMKKSDAVEEFELQDTSDLREEDPTSGKAIQLLDKELLNPTNSAVGAISIIVEKKSAGSEETSYEAYTASLITDGKKIIIASNHPFRELVLCGYYKSKRNKKTWLYRRNNRSLKIGKEENPSQYILINDMNDEMQHADDTRIADDILINILEFNEKLNLASREKSEQRLLPDGTSGTYTRGYNDSEACLVYHLLNIPDQDKVLQPVNNVFRQTIDFLLAKANEQEKDTSDIATKVSYADIKLVVLHIHTKKDPCGMCTKLLTTLSERMNNPTSAVTKHLKQIFEINEKTKEDNPKVQFLKRLNGHFLIEVSSSEHDSEDDKCSHAECSGRSSDKDKPIEINLNITTGAKQANTLFIPYGLIDVRKNFKFRPTFPPYVVFKRLKDDLNICKNTNAVPRHCHIDCIDVKSHASSIPIKPIKPEPDTTTDSATLPEAKDEKLQKQALLSFENIEKKKVTIKAGTNIPKDMVGLEWFHNHCYANAAFQFLFACDPIRDCIINKKSDIDSNFIKALRKLFTAMNEKKEKTIAANRKGQKENNVGLKDIYSVIGQEAKKIDGKEKANKLNNVICNLGTSDTHEDVSELLVPIIDLISQYKSNLKENMYTTIVETISCNKCKNSKILRSVDDSYIGVTISGKDIRKCMRDSFAVNKLEGDNKWYCPECKKKRKATKKSKITKLPNNLILQLNRFGYSTHSSKITEDVIYHETLTIPNAILDEKCTLETKQIRYKLKAVIKHHGSSLNEGHYTVTVLGKNSKWYNINGDEIALNKGFDHSTSAYWLLYERKDDAQAEPEETWEEESKIDIKEVNFQRIEAKIKKIFERNKELKRLKEKINLKELQELYKEASTIIKDFKFGWSSSLFKYNARVNAEDFFDETGDIQEKVKHCYDDPSREDSKYSFGKKGLLEVLNYRKFYDTRKSIPSDVMQQLALYILNKYEGDDADIWGKVFEILAQSEKTKK